MTKLAERLRLSVSMLSNHRRGLRHGREFPTPEPSYSEPIAPNPLERYFDHHAEGPGIWKWRHYFEIYHRHLQGFRGKPVHMVEVGVYGGGSLAMWRDYLGAQARIYGIDIEPECRAYIGDNLEIFIGDQADPSFWTTFKAKVPTIDIVLDDGGHELEQQIVTLEALLPHMRPGGVYICEDVYGIANPFHDYAAGLARTLHSYRLVEHRTPGEAHIEPTPVQQAVSSVHIYPLLVVIEKRKRADHFELVRRGTGWPD